MCIGKSEALSARYIQLLGVGLIAQKLTEVLLTYQIHQKRLERVLDTNKLEMIFDGLGAKRQYLDPTLESEVAPSYEHDPGMCQVSRKSTKARY